MKGLPILFFCYCLFSLLIVSIALDIIAENQTISDGESIVSAGGDFELGFYSPGNSKNRYLGIWYNKISYGTVVWVANRDVPITNNSGIFKLDSRGVLVLSNSTGDIIWSSNSSRAANNLPVAQLLDTGNLVVKDVNDNNAPDNFLWQSFDYPGDTFLAGMKFGHDLETGLDKYLSAWKGPHDPSTSNVTNRLDPNGYPQIFMSTGSVIQFRSGPWNGLRFSGMPNLKPNPIYTFEFVLNEKEIYYEYDLINSSVVTRMVLDPSGSLQRLTWIDRTKEWSLYLTAQMDNCDRYALCGAYGSCNINNSPACACMRGFEPKFPEEWDVADWSNGCVRKSQIDCGKGEGFVKYGSVKLPDTQHSWFNASMNLVECESACLDNCNCTAYANTDIRGGGSGCLMWFGDLIDIREYTDSGQDLYVRMAASELDKNRKGRQKVKFIVTLMSIIVLLLITLLLVLHALKRKKLKRKASIAHDAERDNSKSDRKDLELPLFDFQVIASATNNFCMGSKLGEGGFGPVYKGMLGKGQEIAVKRLSKSSRQGLDEFMNEVLCIAKLQHRNLVKLLGYCIDDEERILIYEYMPNKSLDSYIFENKRKTVLLDWPKRYNIINGIARGLLYLHQDSRLRIIHRDLKASNILLDYEMNPKISDFGMARSFGGNETGANTTRVVGTYGYMSPEYAIDGLFSVKSDVFSFGVLVLEIVSGKKNRGFYHSDHNHNLLGHAWRLYKADNPFELIDSSIVESYTPSEVIRSIQIGLLCVQQDPEERPSMSSVVLMLSSDIELPQPKQPGFFTERRFYDSDSTSSKPISSSANLTVTLLAPR